MTDNIESYRKIAPGTVMNEDDAEYYKYIAQRNLMNRKDNDITSLRNEVEELKAIVRMLVADRE